MKISKIYKWYMIYKACKRWLRENWFDYTLILFIVAALIFCVFGLKDL